MCLWERWPQLQRGEIRYACIMVPREVLECDAKVEIRCGSGVTCGLQENGVAESGSCFRRAPEMQKVDGSIVRCGSLLGGWPHALNEVY